jgi:ABC-type branched-subunit amino acid transport system substrate-binding protein
MRTHTGYPGILRTSTLGLLLGIGASGAATGEEIVIGVISPLDGRQVGVAYQETVRFAFLNADGAIIAGNAAVPLTAMYENDEGNPQMAAARARELEAAGALAIIGPVDSGSTQAVLDAGLDVPVISALSTATSLTGANRNRWFFRMTMSDAERMRQYVSTLRKDKLITGSPLVFYDDASAYGKGLMTDLVAALQMPDVAPVAWRAMSIGAIGAIDPPPATVFLLGSNTVALQHAREIDAVLQAHGGSPGAARFLFVGDDGDLRKSPPPGSLTIGEPTIVDSAGSDIANLRESYAKITSRSVDEFQVTAYEAVEVVRQALAAVVADNARHPGGFASRSKRELREALRDALEQGKFSSLEAWRSIRFNQGDVQGAPPLPVYRANASLELLEVPVPQPFLEVAAPDRAGYLQGPITLRVTPHQVKAVPPLQIVRDVGNGDPVLVESARKDKKSGATEISFYAALPGTYRLVGSLPSQPTQPTVQVVLGTAYPIALLGSLLGSILFALTATPTGRRVSRRRIVLGVVTGCTVAALDFHRALVPGGFALPTLGNTPDVAAFWDGVAGGWVGPSLLVLIAGRLFGAGFESPKSPDAPAKPERAAPHAPSAGTPT